MTTGTVVLLAVALFRLPAPQNVAALDFRADSLLPGTVANFPTVVVINTRTKKLKLPGTRLDSLQYRGRKVTYTDTHSTHQFGLSRPDAHDTSDIVCLGRRELSQ